MASDDNKIFIEVVAETRKAISSLDSLMGKLEEVVSGAGRITQKVTPNIPRFKLPQIDFPITPQEKINKTLEKMENFEKVLPSSKLVDDMKKIMAGDISWEMAPEILRRARSQAEYLDKNYESMSINVANMRKMTDELKNTPVDVEGIDELVKGMDDISSQLMSSSQHYRHFMKIYEAFIKRFNAQKDDSEEFAVTMRREYNKLMPLFARIQVPTNIHTALEPGAPELVKWQTALGCLLYTSPSPRDLSTSRMPSSA